jgi:uncharacterized lipoprotein YehR (DUF1307 family)
VAANHNNPYHEKNSDYSTTTLPIKVVFLSHFLSNVERAPQCYQKSDNKYKATWGIIKEITGRQQQKIEIQDIKVKNIHITDFQDIADAF